MTKFDNSETICFKVPQHEDDYITIINNYKYLLSICDTQEFILTKTTTDIVKQHTPLWYFTEKLERENRIDNISIENLLLLIKRYFKYPSVFASEGYCKIGMHSDAVVNTIEIYDYDLFKLRVKAAIKYFKFIHKYTAGVKSTDVFDVPTAAYDYKAYIKNCKLALLLWMLYTHDKSAYIFVQENNHFFKLLKFLQGTVITHDRLVKFKNIDFAEPLICRKTINGIIIDYDPFELLFGCHTLILQHINPDFTKSRNTAFINLLVRDTFQTLLVKHQESLNDRR